MKQINLSQNKVAIVDDEDFARLSKNKWAFIPVGSGYARSTTRKSAVYMHRLIMNCPKGSTIDHINGDGLDNRKANLRICTQAQNAKNMRLSKLSTSGYKGVYWSKHAKKWRASITVNYKMKNLGYFSTKEEAHAAYQKASNEFHKEFGRV